MAKTKKTKTGEQLPLIEVAPKNAKPIVEAARQYKMAQAARIKALAKEVELKQKVRQLVKEANLQRLKDGVIRFTYDRVTVCITPQDEKVTVTDKTDKTDTAESE